MLRLFKRLFQQMKDDFKLESTKDTIKVYIDTDYRLDTNTIKVSIDPIKGMLTINFGQNKFKTVSDERLIGKSSVMIKRISQRVEINRYITEIELE